MIVQTIIISLPFDLATKMNGLIQETAMRWLRANAYRRREAFDRRYATEATILHCFLALKGRATGECRYRGVGKKRRVSDV